MAIEARPVIKFERLRIISRLYPRDRENASRSGGSNKFTDIFVPLSPIDQQPFVIGTGGFASVFIAFDEENNAQGRPLAVKLLKKEQGTGTPNGRYRFIEEIFYNQKLSGRAAATFVDYHGFGYLGESATSSTQQVAAKEDEWVLKGIEPKDLDEVRHSNRDTAMSTGFLADHQDLFFVMAAAWCSLEQLLVSNQPLHQSNTLNLTFREPRPERQREDALHVPVAVDDKPKSRTQNTAFGAHHEELKGDAKGMSDVASIANKLGISDSTSGLEILSKIRMHPEFGTPVATRMLLQILRSLVNAVSRIHRFQEKGKESESTLQLAHRDLKPANFLVSDCEDQNPVLLLADLGFIAAEQDGRTVYGAFGRVREPGALAQGTVMYQAPEQMLSGREISFELINAGAYAKHQALRDRETTDERMVASTAEPRRRRPFPISDAPPVDGKFLPHAVRVRTVGGIQLDREDRIISSEIQLKDGGDGGRMLIRDIDRDPMYPTSVVAFIAQQIEPNQTTRAEYKGTLVKQVGQHSDIFSLGCHAYFMASGGKDPGEFYRTYLRPGSGLIHLDKTAPRTSCLEIATFLASRNGASGKIREVRTLAAAKNRNQVVEVVKSTVAKAYSVEPTRDHFLFSTDGRPIGIIFLYIIVTLMCRDADESYVSGGPSVSPESSTAWKLRSLTELSGFLNRVIQGLAGQYAVLDDDPFEGLWGDGLNALIKIRLLAPAAIE